MNNHYNFNINPDKLSKEQIEQHQDFDALLAQVEQSPPAPAPQSKYRWLKIVGSTVAAASVALMIYFSLPVPEASSLTAEAYFASQDFINPPFKNIQTPFARYQVDANQGGVYQYKNGSQLVIPPAAFVKQNGELVRGKVDVKYREFHDFVDFFLSGIPMEYDSANLRYQLESAGMMEIYAEQNGQRLNMHPDKQIDVVLLSQINVPKGTQRPPSYNIYKLDVKQRQWRYQTVDQIAFADAAPLDEASLQKAKQNLQRQLQNLDQNYQQALSDLERTLELPKAPIKPIRYNGANAFNLDFEFESFAPANDAALAQQRQYLQGLKEKYGKVYWQFAPDSPPLGTKERKIMWEDIKIKALNDHDFEFTLIHPSKVVKVKVNPVLKASDFEKEMEHYRRQYADYKQQLAQRNDQWQSQKESLQTQLEVDKKALRETFEQQRQNFQQTQANKAQFVSQKVINKFKANSFGIWNCDRPVRPAVAQVNASFVDDKQNKHQNQLAFLADKKKNTVARFYAQQNCQINYDEHSENLLWLVTPDKKIAVFRPEKFKRINQGKDDLTLAVKLIEKEIKSEKDVRDILKFEL